MPLGPPPPALRGTGSGPGRGAVIKIVACGVGFKG